MHRKRGLRIFVIWEKWVSWVPASERRSWILASEEEGWLSELDEALQRVSYVVVVVEGQMEKSALNDCASLSLCQKIF